MRRFHIVLLFILIMSPVLSACGVLTSNAAVVRVGWTTGPDTLNPGMAQLVQSFSIFSLMYDTLYEQTLDGEYRLSLAESVDVSEDSKEWTFKIRNGVKFHDGKPLTADDVVFSFNYYMDHAEDFPFLPGYAANFEKVRTLPGNKVLIQLTQAIPNMKSQLISLYVLPKHVWSEVSDPKQMDVPISQMIGSGPFKLTRYEPGRLIHLDAVRTHFAYHPKIGSVEFLIYSDVSSMIQALQNKEIDLIASVPVSAVAALKDMDGVQIVAGPSVSPMISDIIFNQMSPENCPVDLGGVCDGHPALRDRNVRLALAYAVDKQRLVDELFLGLADPGLTLIPKGAGSFYNSSIKDYEYDVTKANQILNDAGYLDTDQDGVREMPNGGQPLSFRVEWSDSIVYAEAEAELLRIMWSQIGVDIQLLMTTSDDLIARCCPVFDYDIILWEWAADPDPDFLLSIMSTGEIPSGTNETGYANSKYDELYAKQRVEMDDETRIRYIWQMQSMAHADVVYIIPAYQKTIEAYRTDTFRGWITESRMIDLDAVSSLAVLEPPSQ